MTQELISGSPNRKGLFGNDSGFMTGYDQYSFPASDFVGPEFHGALIIEETNVNTAPLAIVADLVYHNDPSIVSSYLAAPLESNQNKGSGFFDAGSIVGFAPIFYENGWEYSVSITPVDINPGIGTYTVDYLVGTSGAPNFSVTRTIDFEQTVLWEFTWYFGYN